MTPAAPGPPITIRPVRRDEVPALWEMLRGLAEYEKLTGILTGDAAMIEAALFADAGPRLEGLVAESAGALLGYALFYPVFGYFRARWRLWLEDLYVKPEARGRGAGVLLMSALCRIASERGWFCVDWEVLDWNEPSLEFYRRTGGHDLGGGWLRWRIDGDAMKALGEKHAPRVKDPV
jgi:ribosomal protein S18 acetylase RimI-like enzyme